MALLFATGVILLVVWVLGAVNRALSVIDQEFQTGTDAQNRFQSRWDVSSLSALLANTA